MANVTSQSVAQMLDKASERFAGVITKTEKAIFDSAVELIKRLDIDANGYIKNTTANLKLLSDIKSKLARFASNKEYLRGVKELAQAFDDIYKQQVAYYSSSFAQKTMGDKAKNKFAAMQRVAVANTIDGLTGAGLQTGVLDSLNKMLLKAVTSGAKYSDLVAEFRSQLISSGDSQSSLAKYAGTYATTAMTQYVGQNNKLFTDDLGTEWFEYVGSSIETTREFCNVLIEHHPYIHKSEIPDILKGEIVSQKTGEVIHVALNPKTGLPKGMIEDTTPENFQINVGGWNCRHQLVPIAKEAVPKAIRERIENKPEPVPDNEVNDEWVEWTNDYAEWLRKIKADAMRTGVDVQVFDDRRLSRDQLNHLSVVKGHEVDVAKQVWQSAYRTCLDLGREAAAVGADDIMQRLVAEISPYSSWENIRTNGERLQQIQLFGKVAAKYQKELDEFKQKKHGVPDELSENASYWQGRGVSLNKAIFALAEAGKPVKVVYERDGKGSWCEGGRWTIHLEVGKRARQSEWQQEAVVYHETGHAIANQRNLCYDQRVIDMRDRQRDYLLETVESTEKTAYRYNSKTNQYEEYQKKVKICRAEKISKELDEVYRRVWNMTDEECIAEFGTKKWNVIEQIASVQDTIMSLTPKYGWGHKKSYMSSSYSRTHEYLAHAFENAFIGNAIFKQYFPTIYEEMIAFINSL